MSTQKGRLSRSSQSPLKVFDGRSADWLVIGKGTLSRPQSICAPYSKPNSFENRATGGTSSRKDWRSRRNRALVCVPRSHIRRIRRYRRHRRARRSLREIGAHDAVVGVPRARHRPGRDRWNTPPRLRRIVLDPFLGSGSTLIAAHKTGRVCRGLELDPLNVDVIIRRHEALTGEAAVLVESGETFEIVAARRARELADTKAEPHRQGAN